MRLLTKLRMVKCSVFTVEFQNQNAKIMHPELETRNLNSTEIHYISSIQSVFNVNQSN